jgi:putative NADPH-quinone reductase
MKNILLLYCHPSPHKSRYNRRLLEKARLVPDLKIRDLYELYPSMHVDEGAEQKALLEADVLVLQFPIYWFSAPALLKEWMDVVLENGFAYGEGGTALKGKKTMIAASTGAPEEAYKPGATHGAKIENFLLPFRMTAEFCGMTVGKPFVTYGVRSLDYDAINARAEAFVDAVQALAASEEA